MAAAAARCVRSLPYKRYHVTTLFVSNQASTPPLARSAAAVGHPPPFLPLSRWEECGGRGQRAGWFTVAGWAVWRRSTSTGVPRLTSCWGLHPCLRAARLAAVAVAVAV